MFSGSIWFLISLLVNVYAWIWWLYLSISVSSSGLRFQILLIFAIITGCSVFFTPEQKVCLRHLWLEMFCSGSWQRLATALFHCRLFVHLRFLYTEAGGTPIRFSCVMDTFPGINPAFYWIGLEIVSAFWICIWFLIPWNQSLFGFPCYRVPWRFWSEILSDDFNVFTDAWFDILFTSFFVEAFCLPPVSVEYQTISGVW